MINQCWKYLVLINLELNIVMTHFKMEDSDMIIK